MPCPYRTIVALIACLLCTGCGGFGLGGGGDLGVVPSALEIEDPARKGKVEGSVVIEPSFLQNFIAALGLAANRSAAGIPDGLEVVVSGSRGEWVRKLDDDGGFAFPPIYAGAYAVRIVHDGRLVARRPVVLRERSTVALVLRIVGFDSADVDDDGDRTELLTIVDATISELETQFRRVFHPDGSAETFLPDGTVELYHAGRVQVVRPNGEIEYRNDFDNDFLSDELDRDDDNDGLPDRRDRELNHDTRKNPLAKGPAGRAAAVATVRGEASVPLLRSVAVTVIGDDERSSRKVSPGDLLRFSALVSAAGGSAVAEVEARLLRADEPVYAFQLRDDGSEHDLVDAWPGVQVSGDEKRGDDSFSYILPIDRTTMKLLHECLLVFRGRNRSGTYTNVRVIPLSTGHVAAEGQTGNPTLGNAMGPFGMYERSTAAGTKQLIARVDVAADESDGVSVKLVLPGGKKKLLTAVGKRAGLAQYRSSDLPWQAGLYLLLATNRAGAVFYAGFPVQGGT